MWAGDGDRFLRLDGVTQTHFVDRTHTEPVLPARHQARDLKHGGCSWHFMYIAPATRFLLLPLLNEVARDLGTTVALRGLPLQRDGVTAYRLVGHLGGWGGCSWKGNGQRCA